MKKELCSFQSVVLQNELDSSSRFESSLPRATEYLANLDTFYRFSAANKTLTKARGLQLTIKRNCKSECQGRRIIFAKQTNMRLFLIRSRTFAWSNARKWKGNETSAEVMIGRLRNSGFDHSIATSITNCFIWPEASAGSMFAFEPRLLRRRRWRRLEFIQSNANPCNFELKSFVNCKLWSAV